jgi:hypothetical protein
MKKIKKIIPGLCLLVLTSCGDKGNNDAEAKASQQEMLSEGIFKAVLRPYNFTAAGWIPNGMADIKINENQIEVKSWLDDSSNVVHMQNIHVGTQCPSMENDINRDGFVDMNESIKVAGKILMALDDDLNSQEIGSVYPKGNYSYFQTASLSKMVSVEGKVIIVTGTANNPALPIACGVIEKKSDIANN